MQELLKKGTYQFVKEAHVPQGATILQSRFVLTIKNFNERNELFKTRLVILGHIDPYKPRVVNEAPTVPKSLVRLALSLIVSYGFRSCSRDITQAFLQSKDPLHREVFIRLLKRENILEILGAESKPLL